MGFQLRNKCDSDVIDYNMLMSCLNEYKAPHRKITQLLKSNILIRIKKGLYVFNSEFREYPISKPYLANLIYGPSYVSQEYALAYYGLIPEKVESVTSMTSKRKKLFDTPIGRFQYSYISLQAYSIGIQIETTESTSKFFIALPEKALADTFAKQPRLTTIKDMTLHLFENLRIDETELHNLDKSMLLKIAEVYKNSNVQLLIRTLKKVING